MEDLFRSFWWLIFPIMGFGFGAFGMFMNYRMHRDRMEILKTYAEKGQTPPPEMAKAMERGGAYDDDGYGYGYRGRWARRGAYWEWRRFFIFVCLAVGFGVANHWRGEEIGGWHNHFMPFGFLTILFSVLALGSLLFAVLATVWKDR